MACDSNRNVNAEAINLVKANYSPFNNFMFFGKGDTYKSVIDKLSERNLTYVNIDLLKRDRIFFPITTGRFILISINGLINTTQDLKIIEVRNLNILNKTIPRLQIGFVNNIIFYAKYESNVEAYNKNNIEFKETDYLNRDLLQELVRAYSEKLGTPYYKNGSFNINHPESLLDQTSKSDLLTYWSQITWINSDSTMHLSFTYDYHKTLSQNKTASFSNIEIVFNRDLAFEIERKADIFNGIEDEKRKRINDSLINVEENKRKSQLDDL
jgi:hypothetical protein